MNLICKRKLKFTYHQSEWSLCCSMGSSKGCQFISWLCNRNLIKWLQLPVSFPKQREWFLETFSSRKCRNCFHRLSRSLQSWWWIGNIKCHLYYSRHTILFAKLFSCQWYAYKVAGATLFFTEVKKQQNLAAGWATGYNTLSAHILEYKQIRI